MNALLLIIELLSAIPTPIVQNRAVSAPSTPIGTGTLIAVMCPPGENIVMMPGSVTGIANADGIVHIAMPTQDRTDEPYRLLNSRGEWQIDGTLMAGQTISGQCP